MKRAIIGFLALLLGACGGGVMTPVAVLTGLVNGVIGGVSNSTASLVTGKVMNHVPGNTTTAGNTGFVVGASFPTGSPVSGVPDISKTPYPDLNTYRNQMLGYVNAQRKAKNLTLVIETPEMDNIAQTHANEMQQAGVQSHNGLPGRLSQAVPLINKFNNGPVPEWCGENVETNYNTAQDGFEAWYHSPEHEVNMVFAGAQMIGLAINNGFAEMILCGKNSG